MVKFSAFFFCLLVWIISGCNKSNLTPVTLPDFSMRLKKVVRHNEYGSFSTTFKTEYFYDATGKIDSIYQAPGRYKIIYLPSGRIDKMQS